MPLTLSLERKKMYPISSKKASKRNTRPNEVCNKKTSKAKDCPIF